AAVPGTVQGAPAGADGHRAGGIDAVARAVVPADPPRGASRGVVGDRGVVLPGGVSEAGPGDIHRAAARADRHRRGSVVAVACVVEAVTADPQRGAGGSIVGDRGVLLVGGRGAPAAAGD